MFLIHKVASRRNLRETESGPTTTTSTIPTVASINPESNYSPMECVYFDPMTDTTTTHKMMNKRISKSKSSIFGNKKSSQHEVEYDEGRSSPLGHTEKDGAKFVP